MAVQDFLDTHTKRRCTSMPQVECEDTTPVIERYVTVYETVGPVSVEGWKFS